MYVYVQQKLVKYRTNATLEMNTNLIYFKEIWKPFLSSWSGAHILVTAPWPIRALTGSCMWVWRGEAGKKQKWKKHDKWCRLYWVCVGHHPWQPGGHQSAQQLALMMTASATVPLETWRLPVDVTSAHPASSAHMTIYTHQLATTMFINMFSRLL